LIGILIIISAGEVKGVWYFCIALGPYMDVYHLHLLPDFCAEILIFAVFPLIFDARNKIISVLERVIPWQDFCFYQIF